MYTRSHIRISECPCKDRLRHIDRVSQSLLPENFITISYPDRRQHLLCSGNKGSGRMTWAEKALHAALDPLRTVAETVFAGRLDPEKLS